MTSEPDPGIGNKSTQDQALPDSVAGHPVLRFAPARAIPFIQLARWDRPIGWWLLLLPCWWSSALAGLAQRQGPDIVHVVLFLIGAIAMRGAGATWNDIVDRHVDAGVERTRGRPLPSGRVTVRQAKVFLVLQALVGALVLFTFNRFAIIVGLTSLLIVVIYPFMKRFTFWPQAVLGLAFAWGGLMGWVAEFGFLAMPAIYIYLAAIFWTIGYDTIYAVQDARDDAIVGIRSTARLFANNVRTGVGIFYLLAVIFAMLAILSVRGTIVAHIGVIVFALHLAWQLRNIVPGDSARALYLFRSNRDAGLILFACLAIAGYLA